MARSLKQNRKSASKAVLIAGNGHVRGDRGVPFYLPPEESLSIVMLEVSADRTEAIRYRSHGADFIYFTPRVDDLDPCEVYRKQLEKMRGGSKQEK